MYLPCFCVHRLPCWWECWEDCERAECEKREQALPQGPTPAPNENPASDQNKTQAFDPSLSAEDPDLDLSSEEDNEGELGKETEGGWRATAGRLGRTQDESAEGNWDEEERKADQLPTQHPWDTQTQFLRFGRRAYHHFAHRS